MLRMDFLPFTLNAEFRYTTEHDLEHEEV